MCAERVKPKTATKKDRNTKKVKPGVLHAMTEKNVALAKYYERSNGSRTINIGKGISIPYDNRTELFVRKKGDKLILEPL